METVPDLLEDLKEQAGTAVTAPDRATPMSAEEAATTAWQMGNLFRHYGVRPGERVAVVPGPAQPTEGDEPGRLGNSPVPILAVLGAMAAGGVVDLDPPGAVDATVLVAPAAWMDRYSTGPGTTQLAYGSESEEAGVAHLEREAWSENPTAPPSDVDAMADALAADRTYAHGDLAATTRRIVAENDIMRGDRVAIATHLTGGTLVAGVLAPLSVGATIVLATAVADSDAIDASVAVGDDPDVERTIDPATVLSR